MAANTGPMAFLSYAHFDNDHDSGRISQFRQALSSEVKIQTGEEFPIFQDTDIGWGENWAQRLEASLDSVTFLIPVITPSYFKSDACREELARFVAREQALKRSDLILPVYYVTCPQLHDPALRKGDALAEVIASRQWADWRHLRFEPFTSPTMMKALETLALQVRNALDRT